MNGQARSRRLADSGRSREEPDRRWVQQRTLNTARVAVIPGGAAIASVVTVSSLLAKEMLGSDRLGGATAAVFTLGAAVTSVPLSALMRRRGRRVGLVTGLIVATVGILGVAVAAQLGWYLLILACMFAFGAAQSANFQARYVVVDLASESERAAMIGAVVWVGTLGAVIGPVVVPQVERLGESLGWRPHVSVFFFATLLVAISALVYQIWLRPDPLVVAGGVDPDAPRQRPLAQARAGLAVIVPNRRAVLAVATMALSQAVMVGVMTMTPPHMRDHGDGGLAGYVIAVHIFGMYGLAPLVGRFVDRVGQQRAIRVGAVTLGAGCAVSIVGGYSQPMVFVGLFLLGLGWNVGLISGTSLLTEVVAPEDRVEAQGSGDMVLLVSSAMAAIASGFVKVAAGFANLVVLAVGIVALLLLWSLVDSPRGGTRSPAS